MTPETKARAATKRAATLQAKRERLARMKAWRADDAGRLAKLGKIEAMAADTRGEPNTRSVAEAMAAKLRTVVKPMPDAPPPLPKSLLDWATARGANVTHLRSK